MRRRCRKCGRLLAEGDRDLLCDQCVALATGGETIEVILELTLKELEVVAQTLKEEAANLRHSGGGDWDREAGILAFVGEAFRTAPEDEKSREAEDAHVQWRQALE